MKIVFLFDCVGCSFEQLQLIKIYEAHRDKLSDTSFEQKQLIIETKMFSHFDLFEDYHVTSKQFYYQDQYLLCVEWSCIHFFYQLLD